MDERKMVNYDEIIGLLYKATNNQIKKIDDYDMDLTLVGLDSMYTISLIILLEEKYCIKFDDSVFLLDKFATVNDIKSTVEKYLNGDC